MSDLKIMSTYYPKETMDEYKWMKKFKVSSRLKDRYVPTERVKTISKIYDFSRFREQKKW